jgi:metallophosphoesterase superfamily enzyme
VANIHPLHPHAALLVEESSSSLLNNGGGRRYKYIAISDLHIGFESTFYIKGISIDSNLLLKETLKELLCIIKSQHINGVILLGDLKNTIGCISKEEWNNVPEFFKSLASSNVDLYLVPGNHDSNIQFLAPDNVNMVSNKGMVLDGDTLLTHGHTMPSSISSAIKRIVMGHIHPIFQKSGSIISGQRVWIYLKVKREALFQGREGGVLDIIVVPSFNNYLFTLPDVGRYSRKSISPLMNRILKKNAVQKALIVTLNGSIIGDTMDILQGVI